MPPKTLCISFFMNARYAAAEDMVNMDMKNTFPAMRCRWEPLRNDIAAAPESNPTRPAQICRTNIGNRISSALLLSEVTPPRSRPTPRLLLRRLWEAPRLARWRHDVLQPHVGDEVAVVLDHVKGVAIQQR